MEGAGPDGGLDFHQTELDWSGTLRARVGVAMSDSILVYGTAGVAFAGTGHLLNRIVVGPTPSLQPEFKYDNKLTGVAYGAGIEIELAGGVAARLEYRRTDFGDAVSPAVLSLFAGSVDDTVSMSTDTVSAGISVYF